MSESVAMAIALIVEKTRAIVCFGPATSTTGNAAGHYYQVTIDPNATSPSGEYIRFGMYQGDEIQGWQRAAAMTIVEHLGVSDDSMVAKVPGYTVSDTASVPMRVVIPEQDKE